MCLFSKWISLEQLFEQDIKSELNKTDTINHTAGQKKVSDLPIIIQKYLSYCGYTADDTITSCAVKWKYAYLKMKPGKGWTPIICKQVNFIRQPARFAYIQAKLFGLLPFGAIDRFKNGRGHMVIKLLNRFTLTGARGSQMDSAELVTILAEAVLVPAYFLQPYIDLIEIAPGAIRATINYNSLSASGIFYFNVYNEFLRFETDDRYYTNNGKFENLKWTAYCWDYKENKGIRFPSMFMAKWDLPHQDYTYFKGKVDEIVLNRA